MRQSPVDVRQCTKVPQKLRATVQNVYAVYKMRVISQNSRRKAIADTATN